MSRFKRIISVVIPLVLFPAVFFYDVIRSTVDLDVPSIAFVREIAILISFFSLYYYINGKKTRVKKGIPREIGKLLVITFSVLVLAGIISLMRQIVFVEKGALLVPQGVMGVFLSVLTSVVMGALSIIMLITVRELIFYKRKKGTKRNFAFYLVALIAGCALSLPFLRATDRLAVSGLYVLTVILLVLNSFRQSWIVYLSRREKIYCIVYSALLFFTNMFLSVLLSNDSVPNRLISSFSQSLHSFVQLNAVFGAVYFGMAFVSTLFHLPTAEVFERKQSELTSLHNLSRLVTQVFDFNDLVNTVTQMTLEVIGATTSWLELVQSSPDGGGVSVELVAQRNINNDQIDELMKGNGFSIRQLMAESKKVLVVDDIAGDKRTKGAMGVNPVKGCLLSVPLISHNELIGILHATKDMEYGFDQDDIDVLTTFADHVTIAIENSKLIARSLERERLHQEIMVAQRMQQRLLPQSVPNIGALDISAISESSYEVGGDYYDFVKLNDDRLGIVVGDVSGKGVSAAFYMAEVKGIFLSLSKICASPRELLVRANHTLMDSLEKNAFISLIYAIVDIRKASLVLARAGHCPVAYISKDGFEMVRPTGLGLGLTNTALFEESTEERTINMSEGDVCVFYTDGITESRRASGEEYGYDRLIEIAVKTKESSAEQIRDSILQDVRAFTGTATYGDDMTLVVLKWIGH